MITGRGEAGMMNSKRVLQVLTFLLGGTFSLAITMLTLTAVYFYTVSAFHYGKSVGQSLVTDGDDRDVTITLPEDATVREVAAILADSGVIGNALIYTLETRLNGIDGGFVGGTHVVNTSMDSNRLNAVLRSKAESTDVRITILEGFNIADIGRYLENREIIESADLMAALADEVFHYGFLDDIPLDQINRYEGYLFPDTYFITPNADAREIINKMLTRFDQVYNIERQARAQELGLTMHEVVTIASLIEKEASTNDDRYKLSALIHNRLALDMPLALDATVVYVLDKRRDRLTAADLRVDSPYNTHVHKGLPIGPIANPGEASIDAALNPPDANYLYFLLVDAETGEHFFTDDYDAYMAMRAQLAADE